MHTEEHNPSTVQRARRVLSLKALLIVAVGAMLFTIAFMAGSDLFNAQLEFAKPIIRVLDMPRGIGLTPVTLRLELSDPDSGLHEVSVRTRQRGEYREVLNTDLQGLFRRRISIEFQGEESGLEEGSVDIEVRVTDRSTWNNAMLQVFPLRVDFHRPKVEVLSVTSQIRAGSAELLFYRALDEDLALSGVKVGNQTFLGYPARGLDRDLSDATLFVALYALDLRSPPGPLGLKVFAEDQVGNAASIEVDSRAAGGILAERRVAVTEDFLRLRSGPLADQNIQDIRETLQRAGQGFDYVAPAGGIERLIEKFQFVNESLRQKSELNLVSLLKGPRFESYWKEAFLAPRGKREFEFGDQLRFMFQERELGRAVQSGERYSFKRDEDEVMAASDGIVLFSENIGTFGRTVALDHGLGVVSVYSQLDSVIVHKGEAVSRAQRIGTIGESGLSHHAGLEFQIRVQGVAIDPREWCDDKWFISHIETKINEQKRSLGIPVYRVLE